MHTTCDSVIRFICDKELSKLYKRLVQVTCMGVYSARLYYNLQRHSRRQWWSAQASL